MPEDPDMAAARVAERGDEEVELLRDAGDQDAPLAEVDLQLLAGRGLESHRRPRLGAERLAQRRDRALYGAQRDGDPVLALQVLAHDVGVAVLLAEALGHPVGERVQRLRPGATHHRRPGALAEVALHGVAGAADLAGDALGAPAELVEAQDDGDIVGCSHGLPVRAVRCWRTGRRRNREGWCRGGTGGEGRQERRVEQVGHGTTSRGEGGGGQFLVSSGGQLTVSPDSRSIG